MSKDLLHIEFYFPDGTFKDKTEVVDSILSLMKSQGSIDYSGFADTELLKQGLLNHIGNGDVSRYKKISETQKSEIEKTITKTIEKCNDILSIPTKNFIFVHPYFTTEHDKIFDGVMAVAVYSCVFHLFVNLDEYSKKSIENTVAHELNHTIYYYYHYNDFNNYTLLDAILLEGLAENFREQYFDPAISKWAGALRKDEAFEILRKSEDLLNSRDQEKIQAFLFGNSEYKRWTGYSVGYWLVKEYMHKNKHVSWDMLMKMDAEAFLVIENT